MLWFGFDQHPSGTLRGSTQSDSSEYSTAPHQLITLVLVALAILFMLTPLSEPLWRYLPEFRFLQFPWRLLAVLGTVFGIALARALSRTPLRGGLTAILCATVFALPSYYAFHEFCYPEDTVPERLAVFHSANPGTDPTDEYTPTTADNDSLSQSNPGYWLASSPDASAPPSSVPGPAPLQLDLSPAAPATLILNLRNYPAWQITRNGSRISIRLPRKDGLISIPLDAGPAHIKITYAMLPDQRFGYLLTAFSLMLYAVLLLRNRRATQTY